MKRIYWDTAAGTALDKRVFEAMKPFLTGKFGNAHSIHKEGVEAERAVEEARAKIAQILAAHPDEIIFTGSGTESDNLAVLGTAEAIGVRSPISLHEKRLLTPRPGHIITTDIEHKAVLEPCHYLQKKGFKVTYLKTNKEGQINLKELKESLTKDTFLVSIMMANNEIGAIQAIKEIAKVIRHFRKENSSTKTPYLHTDACQAPRFLDLNVEKLGVDLLSFNGSKIYGPKGVGCLFVRRGVMLEPQMRGGGQERGLRSGTLNVPGIVGLARALEICEAERAREIKKLTKLQIKLISELKKIPNLKINGPDAVRNATSSVPEVVFRTASEAEDVRDPISLREKRLLTSSLSRLPNNINFSIAGFEGEQLVIELDAKGFAVSSGSACSSNDPINNNVRVSFGREVQANEITAFVKALKRIVEKYQKCYN